MLWGKGQDMGFQGTNATTLISKASEIVGDITFSGELEIQGVISGNVFAKAGEKANLRVVEGGRIEGDIHVPQVIINGSVVGNIYSSEHVELAAKASVKGDVHYHLIEMVKGAQVNGNLLYAKERVLEPVAEDVLKNTVKVD